ncbi:MAG: pyruvate kinase, partial [Armatimonadetes bacterium]|nr:pyruvate kinase [Armatimonadota bacterium]
MKRRTKIVCTLGPAVDSKAQIKRLVSAGMNVARINCGHGDWETRRKWREWIRQSQPDLAPVGVLVDLQGPKFRIGPVPDGSMGLSTGETLTVAQHGDCTISVGDDVIWSAMKPGDRLLLGDGDVELKLGDKNKDVFECTAVSGGLVRSRQGVTLVGKSFDVPALTDKDRQDVYEAVKLDTDFIALSYVRRADDMRELRKLVDEYDPSVRLVAKIETRQALDELDEILKVSDVVMVARGDLGLQMDIEDVPVAQKRII